MGFLLPLMFVGGGAGLRSLDWQRFECYTELANA